MYASSDYPPFMNPVEHHFCIGREILHVYVFEPTTISTVSWHAGKLIINGGEIAHVDGKFILGTRVETFQSPIWRADCSWTRFERGIRVAVHLSVHMGHLVDAHRLGLRVPARNTIVRAVRASDRSSELGVDNAVLRVVYAHHSGNPAPRLFTDMQAAFDAIVTVPATADPSTRVRPDDALTEPYAFQSRTIARMTYLDNTPQVWNTVHRKFTRMATSDAELFVDCHGRFFERHECELVSATARGGIVAEELGMGKTLCMLYTCALNPIVRRTSVLRPSSTLIVCPAHVVRQWKAEVDRHLGNRNVHVIATKRDLQRLTIGEMLSDAAPHFVIVSFNVFENPVYKARIDDYGSSGITVSFEIARSEILRMRPADRDATIAFPHLLNWGRIVVDEFHELGADNAATKMQHIQALVGDRKWLISGTPKCNIYRTAPMITAMFNPSEVGIKEYDIGMAIARNRTVKNSSYDVELPGVVEEVHLIDLSATERRIYDAVAHEGRVHQLRACSSPRLAVMSPNDVHTLDEMQTVVVDHLRSRISGAEVRIEQLRVSLVMTSSGNNDEPGTRLAQLRRETLAHLDRALALRDTLEKRLSFMSNSHDVATECVICLDNVDRPTMLRSCGHRFCEMCISRSIATNPSCPICRVSTSVRDMITLAPPSCSDDFARLVDSFGSKVAHLIRYIRTSTGEKTLVFSQYEGVLRDVGSCLAKFANVLYVRGSVTQKSAALDKFESSPDHNLLLLSTLNGGSGNDLTRASRIVILDVVDGTAATVRGTERQAVARCHRIGQQKIVKLVRFIARDTIEETIYDDVYKSMAWG